MSTKKMFAGILLGVVNLALTKRKIIAWCRAALIVIF